MCTSVRMQQGKDTEATGNSTSIREYCIVPSALNSLTKAIATRSDRPDRVWFHSSTYFLLVKLSSQFAARSVRTARLARADSSSAEACLLLPVLCLDLALVAIS